MTNYYQFTPSIPVVGQQAINPNDQRIFPLFGLGLGFLGGLATGALLAPGPGFGFRHPGLGFGGPGSGFGFAPQVLVLVDQVQDLVSHQVLVLVDQVQDLVSHQVLVLAVQVQDLVSHQVLVLVDQVQDLGFAPGLGFGGPGLF